MDEALPIERLIPVTKAIQALRSLPVGTVCVLGAEGFTEPLRPNLDYIADFSDQFVSFDAQEADLSVQRAIQTIGEWPSTLLVELVAEPTRT